MNMIDTRTRSMAILALTVRRRNMADQIWVVKKRLRGYFHFLQKMSFLLPKTDLHSKRNPQIVKSDIRHCKELAQFNFSTSFHIWLTLAACAIDELILTLAEKSNMEK